jgi:hypothetical protein
MVGATRGQVNESRGVGAIPKVSWRKIAITLIDPVTGVLSGNA